MSDARFNSAFDGIPQGRRQVFREPGELEGSLPAEP